jgi:flagellin
MSVNSILTNSSALSALQSLNMTEQNLSITQNQVSSGLAVANASQNAAYWSVGQQLSSDSGIVTAANSALSQSQAVFDTATSAINSVITTINSIQTALGEATNPGADFTTINTQLGELSKQLTDAVAGASFNGTNVLNASQSNSVPLLFVSGFDASATGGAVSTISFQAQALTGASGALVATTTQAPTINFSNLSTSNAANIASLAALSATGDTTAAGLIANPTATATFGAVYGSNTYASSTATAGSGGGASTLADTTGDSFRSTPWRSTEP